MVHSLPDVIIRDFLHHMRELDGMDLHIPYGYTGEQVGMMLLHYMVRHNSLDTRSYVNWWGIPLNGIKRILEKV